jgi:hypothetical protein
MHKRVEVYISFFFELFPEIPTESTMPSPPFPTGARASEYMDQREAQQQKDGQFAQLDAS